MIQKDEHSIVSKLSLLQKTLTTILSTLQIIAVLLVAILLNQCSN